MSLSRVSTEPAAAQNPAPARGSLVRLTLAAVVAGTIAAVVIAAHTEQAFGWMFESGVVIAIVLSHTRWTAAAAISLRSVRYGTTAQRDAVIMRNPWSMYPLFGTAGFLLLGIPIAAVLQHQYDPAYLTAGLLPFAFAAWILVVLEPLVKRLPPLPKDHPNWMWLSAMRHPSMSALIGAAIFAILGAIMAIHDASGMLADAGGLGYTGGMMGIAFWEGKYGGKARRIRAHETYGGHL